MFSFDSVYIYQNLNLNLHIERTLRNTTEFVRNKKKIFQIKEFFREVLLRNLLKRVELWKQNFKQREHVQFKDVQNKGF